MADTMLGQNPVSLIHKLGYRHKRAIFKRQTHFQPMCPGDLAIEYNFYFHFPQ